MSLKSLSVCILCRNDRDPLRRALASVAPVAHQIVVCDTGSTDGSIALARSSGALVVERAWDDDFSAARNYALVHAVGDWILLLDADEELMPGGIAALQSAIKSSQVLAYRIPRLDLQRLPAELTTHGVGESGTWMLHPRLHRNGFGLRYTGRCHPQFVRPLTVVADEAGLKLSEAPVLLRHYGYINPVNLRFKLERGARLMRLELADRPGQTYYEIELGRTLMSLGDPSGVELLRKNAVELWQRRAEPTPPLPLSALLLDYLLSAPPNETRLELPQHELEALALRWFPRSAPFHWHIARRQFERQDFSESRRLMEVLWRMARDQSYDREVSFDERILGDELRLNLGMVCVRLTDLDAAEAHFKAVSTHGLHAEAAQRNLGVVLEIRRQLG